MFVKSGTALRRNDRCAGCPMEDLPNGQNVALNRAQPVAPMRERHCSLHQRNHPTGDSPMSSTNPVDILSLQKISQHPCMQPALAARETIARRAEAIYPQIHQEKQQIALARLAQKDDPTGGSEGLISSSLARIQALERRLSDLQPEIDA